jgi:hypothetical protein
MDIWIVFWSTISSPLRVETTLVHIHVENESNSPRWYGNTTTLAQLQPWKIIPFNISYFYFFDIFLTTISIFTFDFVPLQSFCHVNKLEAIIHIIEITSLIVVILLIFGFASLYILIICKNRTHNFCILFSTPWVHVLIGLSTQWKTYLKGSA